MSTAHRPTWHNAIGKSPGINFGTFKVSSRDLPSHSELKRRAPVVPLHESDDHVPKSQKINEQQRILKSKLEDTEKANRARNEIEERVGVTKNFISLEDAVKLLNQDINVFPEDEDDGDCQGAIEDQEQNRNHDDSSDDDEEEAMLLRELEKIKSEKEQARQNELAINANEEEEKEQILRHNPLLNNNSNTFKRWDEDVVFKNPVRESKKKPE
ncbi:Pre-mRNA-splicing factor Cwf15-Cwc15 [Babesia duncani]|uniref:Pre-mRNA-splicing factor Cwf15-Cwc15 n=1 Tax=Babesia duncani TaxID=323732 RepID=A0AAD9PK55_9APIC|nr:Pre-mRNA-splicing factor Cwf15-Cwc15 [Babesia duncani]